jgi:hypothetical protein
MLRALSRVFAVLVVLVVLVVLRVFGRDDRVVLGQREIRELPLRGVVARLVFDE